ncbi:hypothetical protein MHBO_001840 [Bonamia ostreae]|uniref:PROP1-like PPR domain-containing protein n=1 Tax=Bonamia ostreae TaxID=126728 RepID=A0ABV2AKX8_9EUKA
MLLEKKLKPDEHTFNTLIATAANAQDFEKGFSFFEMMNDHKVISNMQTLTTVLKLCAQKGDLAKALNIFESAEKSLEPDTVMWNSLLNVCAKTGNCEQGFSLWEKMCQSRCFK